MSKKPLILGIESSCDETAASLISENDQGNPIVLSNIVSVSCQCENSHAGCAGEGNYDPIIFNDAPSPSSEKRTVKKRITVKPKSKGIQATVYMARCEKIMSTHGLDAHITCRVQSGDKNVYGWCINSTCTVCIGKNKELKHHADMAISTECKYESMTIDSACSSTLT